MDHLLESIGEKWIKASVQGKLIEPGSSFGVHYPGVILDDEGEEIERYLFTSEDLPNHWHTIDRYEGSDYKRIKTEVTTEDGEAVAAYIYELAISL